MLRKDLHKPFTSSADPREIAKFNATAAEWRSPTGAYRVVHAFNAMRLNWLFKTIGQPSTLLDAGCATGLVSEAFCRRGTFVTGIDVAERNIQIARQCAHQSGLDIDYRLATPEETAALQPQHFDAVLALEVAEHVQNLDGFVDALFTCVKPSGMVAIATLNRTWQSWFIGIFMAEHVLGWLPKGTHAWQNFVKPETLDSAAARFGFERVAQSGVTFNPFRWRWQLSHNLNVNYMVVYRKRS